MKKTILNEVNEIRQMMGLINEEDNNNKVIEIAKGLINSPRYQEIINDWSDYTDDYDDPYEFKNDVIEKIAEDYHEDDFHEDLKMEIDDLKGFEIMQMAM